VWHRDFAFWGSATWLLAWRLQLQSLTLSAQQYRTEGKSLRRVQSLLSLERKTASNLFGIVASTHSVPKRSRAAPSILPISARVVWIYNSLAMPFFRLLRFTHRLLQVPYDDSSWARCCPTFDCGQHSVRVCVGLRSHLAFQYNTREDIIQSVYVLVSDGGLISAAVALSQSRSAQDCYPFNLAEDNFGRRTSFCGETHTLSFSN
jgi:hypothetical protein